MFFSGIADEAGKPLESQVRAHKELGWKHIEVRNVNATTLAYASEQEFDEIHSALKKAGLQVSCFASQIANWSREVSGPFEKDVEELSKAIPRMNKMGTPFIRIMSYANKNKVDEKVWRDEAIKRVKQMAKMAEDGGITLVHENCDGWGGLGAAQTLELLREVNSPALKLVFDTGNTVHHKQDSFGYYHAVKQHIAYIHIKDYKPEGEKQVACFPGQGLGDVRKILVDLMTWYDGGISIEPHMAAVVHEGTESPADAMYRTYTEYGRRLMALMADVQKSAKAAPAKKPGK